MNTVAELSAEIERLKAGRFTPEEFQNLCHGLSEDNREAFFEGCADYQRKLFGTAACDELRAQLAASQQRVAELERIRDENYSDLLDQMDEAWGRYPNHGAAAEIGREEINAFLESRVVHRPATRLREQVAQLQAAKSVWEQAILIVSDFIAMTAAAFNRKYGIAEGRIGLSVLLHALEAARDAQPEGRE